MKFLRLLWGIVVLSLLGVTAACSLAGGEDVRHGKNVLIDRVNILGRVQEGYWVNETSSRGSGVAPGPSDRWQEGVARLTDAEFDRIRNAYQWQPVEYGTPHIRSSLDGKLKIGGTWLESEDFNAAGSTADFDVSFYLETESHVVLFLLNEAGP